MQLLPATLMLLTGFFACSTATSCNNFPCDTSLCPLRFCPQGYTREPCGCCNLCAQKEGERCGGLDNMFGRCGLGLVCNRPQDSHATTKGICHRLPGCIDYTGGRTGSYLTIGMTAHHNCTRCHCKGDKQLHCYRANTEKCRFIQRHDSGMMNSPDNFGPAAPSPTTPDPITLEPSASGNHTNKLNGTEENDSDPTHNDAFSLLRELFLDMFVR